MRFLPALSSALLLCVAASAAVDRKAKSTSNSKQFIVYCEDAALRGRVASFVEDVKRDTLEVLGMADRWLIPVVVSLEAGDATPPVHLNFLQTPQGPSIQLSVKVGSDPAAVHLQKHIIRAVMLDFIYRDRKVPTAGAEYVEAPWWFIDGVIESARQRNEGLNAGLYRRLVETNKLPPIADFLAGHGDELGPTARAFDSACAMAFLQLLLEQPEGRSRLCGMLRTWPQSSRDPVEAVRTAFPTLGEDAAGLQKWWTLNLARFAASDRHQGQAMEETDRKLTELLEFEVAVDKKGTKKKFTVSQFAEWAGAPGGKAAAAAQHQAVVDLSVRSNALMRPALSGYEFIFSQLSRGRTKGIADRIMRVEKYRSVIVHQRDKIEDYLNWYEATQIGARSNIFDNYLRSMDAIGSQQQKPAPTENASEICKYIDLIESEF